MLGQSARRFILGWGAGDDIAFPTIQPGDSPSDSAAKGGLTSGSTSITACAPLCSKQSIRLGMDCFQVAAGKSTALKSAGFPSDETIY